MERGKRVMAKMCTIINKLCDECEQYTVIKLPKVCTVTASIKTYDPERDGKINMVIGR